MNNLSIKTKLLILSILSCVALVVLGGTFTVTSLAQSKTLNNLYSVDFARFQAVNQFQSDIKDVNNKVYETTVNFANNLVGLDSALASAESIMTALSEKVSSFSSFKKDLAWSETQRADTGSVASAKDGRVVDPMATSQENLLAYKDAISIWYADFKSGSGGSSAMFLTNAEDSFLPLVQNLETMKGVYGQEFNTIYTRALDDLKATTSFVLILVLSTLLISIIGSFLVIRSILVPFRKIVPAIEKAAAGDLTFSISVLGKDEMGQIAAALQKMQATQKNLIMQAQADATENLSASDKLGALSKKSADSAEEISHGGSSIDSQMKNLASRIGYLNDLAKRNADYIDNVMRLIQALSSSMEQSFASIEQMDASLGNIFRTTDSKMSMVNALLDLSVHGAEKVQATMKAVEHLTASSEEIRGIVNVIKKVSAQTKVLGINAAIEAAHAGEVGTGFAVVSEEVQTLSRSTEISVSEIEKKISAVNTELVELSKTFAVTVGTFREISTAITSLSASFKEMKDGVHEVSIGSNEISNALRSLVSQTATVKEDSQSVSEHSREFGDGLSQLKDIGQSVESAIKEMSRELQSMAQVARTLRSNSTDLHESSSRLLGSVKTFKV